MAIENLLKRCNDIVIKIGTAAITTLSNGIDEDVIERLAKSCNYLLEKGKYVSIVTSGAIACGKGRVERYASANLPETYATIGQPILMQAYIDAFAKYNRNVAQLLLTDDDFDNKERLKLLKRVHSELLAHKEVPIINENDVIATEEITFGDNDILAARVTVDLNQDLLLNLTVYDGLISKKGRTLETARSYNARDYADFSREVRRGGSGGLKSKLKSAKICTDNGKICRIGNINRSIINTLMGETLSTTFYPD